MEAQEAREGFSSTPLDRKISNLGTGNPYVIKAVGANEITFTLSISGDSVRAANDLSEHNWRPKGMPGTFFLGRPYLDGYKHRFRYLLDRSDCKVMYHRDSGTLRVRLHFEDLASTPIVHVSVLEAVAQLEEHGLSTFMSPLVARIDYAADVIFRDPSYYRYAHSAFASMIPGRGRVVQPVKHSLYLYASESPKSKRLGRIYDKGRELSEVHGYDLPVETYMRIEAEQHHSPRPQLDTLHPNESRTTFLDRFEAVGAGTVTLKGGLVDPLMQLRRSGKITPSQFERLYTFLDMCRMGLAEQLYAENRDLYLARAREARRLGLEVPGNDRSAEDLEHELDVRALVREASLAF